MRKVFRAADQHTDDDVISSSWVDISFSNIRQYFGGERVNMSFLNCLNACIHVHSYSLLMKCCKCAGGSVMEVKSLFMMVLYLTLWIHKDTHSYSRVSVLYVTLINETIFLCIMYISIICLTFTHSLS